jgi:hypothetical protein
MLALKHSATIQWPDSLEMLIELLLRQNRHIADEVVLLIDPVETIPLE